MPTAAQLKFLLKRAQEESDGTSQHFAETKKALASSAAKLALLASYREDYSAQLGATAAQGMDTDRMRNFQRFIANVTQAIVQQQKEVERCKASTQRAESAWLDAQRGLQSYRTLAERHASRARLAEGRKQQKQSDEFSNQNFLRLVGKT
jgi:flagellar FliJ protein